VIPSTKLLDPVATALGSDTSSRQKTRRRRFRSPRPLRHLHAGHQLQNDSLSSRDPFGIELWIENGARVRNHRREKRAFARIQVRRRLVKVILRCGFGAVNSITPLNHVQINFQDAPFRQVALHEVSDERFLTFVQAIGGRLRDAEQDIDVALTAEAFMDNLRLSRAARFVRDPHAYFEELRNNPIRMPEEP